MAFCAVISTSAQNQNEAKAAYLLAEEFYAKGDYSNTLKFLDITESNLGSTNCKILYLKIITLSEVGKKEDNIEAQLQSITQFEQSPDYPDFNAEKRLEVSKIKLLLMEEFKKIDDAKKRENEIRLARERAMSIPKEKFDEVFKKILGDLPPIGSDYQTLVNLKKSQGKSKKDLAAEVQVDNATGIGIIYFEENQPSFSAGIINSKISFYKKNYYVHIGKAKGELRDVKLKEISQIIEQNIGISPTVIDYKDLDYYKNKDIDFQVYQWQIGDKVITISSNAIEVLGEFHTSVDLIFSSIQ